MNHLGILNDVPVTYFGFDVEEQERKGTKTKMEKIEEREKLIRVYRMPAAEPTKDGTDRVSAVSLRFIRPPTLIEKRLNKG